MTSQNLVAVLLLSASVLVSVVESACPDEGVIKPCTCQVESRRTVMRCSNILRASVLEKVAQNSNGYKYHEVHIEASSLQFIPKVVLETIRMRNLTLRNLTLTRFADGIPNSSKMLKFVQLYNMEILKGMSWEVFKNTPGLRSLKVDHLTIPVITDEFSKYVSHKLQFLRLENTATKEITKGAFQGFQAIPRFSLKNNNLKSLRRDSFPTTFYTQILDLEYNKLTTLPDDFFSGIIGLVAVYLRGNLISRMDEKVFGISAYVDVSKNPIKCDCYFKWIVDRQLTNFRGVCSAPKRLIGISIEQLADADFNC